MPIKSTKNKTAFKKYSGPIDLDFLSPLPPKQMFKKLKEILKTADFSTKVDDK